MVFPIPGTLWFMWEAIARWLQTGLIWIGTDSGRGSSVRPGVQRAQTEIANLCDGAGRGPERKVESLGDKCTWDGFCSGDWCYDGTTLDVAANGGAPVCHALTRQTVRHGVASFGRRSSCKSKATFKRFYAVRIFTGGGTNSI